LEINTRYSKYFFHNVLAITIASQNDLNDFGLCLQNKCSRMEMQTWLSFTQSYLRHTWYASETCWEIHDPISSKLFSENLQQSR